MMTAMSHHAYLCACMNRIGNTYTIAVSTVFPIFRVFLVHYCLLRILEVIHRIHPVYRIKQVAVIELFVVSFFYQSFLLKALERHGNIIVHQHLQNRHSPFRLGHLRPIEPTSLWSIWKTVAMHHHQ